MSGLVAVDEKGLETAARNSAGEEGEHKDESVSSRHVAGRSSER